MTNEERYFLEVLHALNWPISLRLIYADWLEEHDQAEHGQQIRRDILHGLIMEHYRVPLLPGRPLID